MKKRTKQKKFLSISVPVLIIAAALSLAINVVLCQQEKTRLAASVSLPTDVVTMDRADPEPDRPEEVISKEDTIRMEIERLKTEMEKTMAQIQEMQGGKGINEILLSGCITEAEAFYKGKEMSNAVKTGLQQKKDECLKKYSIE